jgi:hypothetical protein
MAATGSSRAPRWLLAGAAIAGFLGLMLKLSDFTSPPEPPPAVPADASDGGSHARRTPSGQAARPIDTARHPSAGDDVAAADDGSPADTGDGLARLPSARTIPGDRPRARIERPGVAARRAARQARRAARQQMAAGRPDPSVSVGAAAGDATAHLGDGGAPALGGQAAAVQAAQPAAPQDAAKPAPPEAPEAPAVSDVTFASEDTAQYTTSDPVAVEGLDNIGPRAGSLSFWLQPQWGEGSADDASFLELGDGQLRVVKNVNYLRFEWMSQDGGSSGIGVPIAEWKPGEWHAVTTTWNGNTYSLYVDGQLVSTKTDFGAVPLPDDPRLWIGSNYPETRPIAPGLISRVDVRNRPLGPGEVAAGFNATTGR